MTNSNSETTLNQCWIDVDPLSLKLVQHQTNIATLSHICQAAA